VPAVFVPADVSSQSNSALYRATFFENVLFIESVSANRPS
jgi:hypothetical protein